MSARARTAVAALVLFAGACSEHTPEPEQKPEDSGLDPSCTRSDRDELAAPRRHTAKWAFEPWISKDISNRDDTYAFVDGFRSRGIPVGAVVLDSPWETSYNTFVPNETRYRDLPGMIRDMHDRGVRVVLWMTPLVNQTSFDFEPGGDAYSGPAPNLEPGLACDYFVDDGELYGWWKGRGAAVDFFNADARAWWHRQQDPLYDAGLDGWKLDFGESYMRVDAVDTFEGQKPFQEYSERYYEDFLAYGRKRRGDDFVTMVRAWDESYDFPGRFFAKKEHAPVAWMGDNRRDWVGLADALDHMFVSARAGYAVVGSDIGGYLDHDDKDLLGPEIPFDTLNFARWVAVGALSPFMQLHGRANLEPWSVPDHADETVELYRYWATLHHRLVPFFYSLSEEAHAGAPSVLRPMGDPATWAGDYRYTLGDAFLVAPILDASGKRDVALPAGARWIDWWTRAVHEGGTTVAADFSADRAKVPLYVREGAVVPFDEDGRRVIHVFPGPETTFPLHEDDGSITTVTARADAAKVSVGFSRVPVATTLRVEGATDRDVPVSAGPVTVVVDR